MDGTTERPAIDLKAPGFLDPRDSSLVVRFGRGRTGGSTILDLLVQLARHVGREVVIGDGDRRNATLASLYPPGTPGGALQPSTDEVPDVKDWITDLLGNAIGLGQSVVLDLGGGDRVMQEYGRDLALVDFCEEAGLRPLGLFVTGPEADDFEHVLGIWRAGYFRPKRALLVFNEHLVPAGKTTSGAFDAIMNRPEVGEIEKEGVKTIFLPRLPCMGHVRDSGLSIIDAATNIAGRSGKPLDPARQFMVRQWIVRTLAEFERVRALRW